jgi:hypothetical protein
MTNYTVAISIAVCCLTMTSVEAHELSKSQVDIALGDIKNPCALNSDFLNLHDTLIDLGQTAIDVGDEAHHLHHTSLSGPYRKIEDLSSEITTRAWPQLVRLTNMQVAIDSAPESSKLESNKKQAALNLINAYQIALMQITDYTHAAVYYEHSENALSFNYRNAYLDYGVTRLAPQMVGDNVALFSFDTQFTEAKDALRLLDFPEHRYSLFCHLLSFSKSIPKRQH